MTHLRNDYAAMLTEKRILYVPSCMIVEMLTKLSAQIATINLSGSLHTVTPDLLILLRRMRDNLRVTADAYAESRIRHLIGDWSDDKRRARKLFFNIMSDLGYISELLERVERNMLFSAIEGVTAEWAALDRLVDAKAEERKSPAGGIRSAYCDCDDGGWRREMARSLAALHGAMEYHGGGDSLIILCNARVARLLADAVGDELRGGEPASRFETERILSVSRDAHPGLCRKCSARGSGDTAAGIPPSLRGVSCPVRPPQPRGARRYALP